jgi:hypothetical protein
LDGIGSVVVIILLGITPILMVYHFPEFQFGPLGYTIVMMTGYSAVGPLIPNLGSLKKVISEHILTMVKRTIIIIDTAKSVIGLF